MPTGQQENFREMVDHILPWAGDFPPQLIRRSINDVLAEIIARRPWSGLITYGILEIPAAYSIGTVDIAFGSNVVTGTSTAWAINDKVNTTLSSAVQEAGMVDATPASMSGIAPGIWLLIDKGEADEEAVFVVSSTSTTFRAQFTKTHSAAETVTGSSLAGRQFRTTTSTPFYTVTGVSSATRLLLDRTWASAAASASSYTISKLYASFGQDAKMLLSVVNPSQSYQFTLHLPKAMIDSLDPQRGQTGNTYMAVFHSTDPAGSPLYELYPRPTSQTAFPYIYLRQWDRMEDDNDLLPNGIRSDVVVDRVIAEALTFPGNKGRDGGKHYDPTVAAGKIRLFYDVKLPTMELEDDNTAMSRMLFNYSRLPFHPSAEWHQGHDYDTWRGNF